MFFAAAGDAGAGAAAALAVTAAAATAATAGCLHGRSCVVSLMRSAHTQPYVEAKRIVFATYGWLVVPAIEGLRWSVFSLF